MINPADDVWVWACAALFLAVMAVRATVVETGRTRIGRTSRQVKALTGLSAVVLAGLVVLLGMQGGVLLVSSIINKTDPATAFYGTPPAAPAPNPGG
jgi:hypothetical protein